MAKDKVSGRQACIAAIRAAGKPLSANEIATAVIESGVVPTLKGKTPKATLSAQITSGAKKGEIFKKVGSGKPQKFDVVAGVDDTPDDLLEALRKQIEAAAAPAEPVEDVTEAPAAEAKDGDLAKGDVTPVPKPEKTEKTPGRGLGRRGSKARATA